MIGPGQCITAGIIAWRGMVAGCVSATRELKAYMKDMLNDMIINNPAVQIDAWIDDVTLETNNSSKEVVEANITKATKELRTAAAEECALEFAELKTAIVASGNGLAAGIAAKVGSRKLAARGVKTQARVLGTDQTAGKNSLGRTKKGDNTQQERKIKCKKRIAKAKRFFRASHRQLMVWKTGTLAAAGFGCEIYGVTASNLKWMRSAAARLSPGGGNGVLQAAVLGLHGHNDPARKVLCGPIVRYHEEIWVCSDHELWHSRHLHPVQLYQGVGKVART